MCRGEIVSNKQVAATVIIDHLSGGKKFLLRNTQDPFHFMVTEVKENLTGLASTLAFLKEELSLPVDRLELIELTNVHSEKGQIPFFVFNLQEEAPLSNPQFSWGEAEEFRHAVEGFTLEGAPLF